MKSKILTCSRKITFILQIVKEVNVKVIGIAAYIKTHKTQSLNVTIKGSGTTMVSIYFDDELSQHELILKGGI